MEEIIVTALARAEDTLRNHEVVVECEEHLTAAVSPNAIAQVLFSMLENAARYAPPATAIGITAGHRDGAGEIEIAVEDEGPGVPLHLRERIFDKFFRGDAPERQCAQTRGLGLGLAIARGIIEAHDGKIWSEGRGEGKSGARFVFTIPSESKVGPIQTESERTVPQ